MSRDQQSFSSDKKPANISIKTTEKENKTANYLEILDLKFNKRIKPQQKVAEVKIKTRDQFNNLCASLQEQIDKKFREEGTSDHGLIDYVLQLWRNLKV